MNAKNCSKSMSGIQKERFGNDRLAKEISSKEGCPSKAFLSRRKLFCGLNSQDVRFAVTTFPEFFPRADVFDAEMKVVNTLLKMQKQENQHFLDKKPSLRNDDEGLVLWYIQEYGL